MKKSEIIPTPDSIKEEARNKSKGGSKLLKSLIVILMFLSAILVASCIVFVRHPHYH
jgi:hypothetical protein